MSNMSFLTPDLIARTERWEAIWNGEVGAIWNRGVGGDLGRRGGRRSGTERWEAIWYREVGGDLGQTLTRTVPGQSDSRR